jgi:hypothetical protein
VHARREFAAALMRGTAGALSTRNPKHTQAAWWSISGTAIHVLMYLSACSVSSFADAFASRNSSAANQKKTVDDALRPCACQCGFLDIRAVPISTKSAR